MSMLYSDDDRMLADSAEEFFSAQSPVAAQRALRDKSSELNYDPNVWQQMLELGWAGVTFPEQLGGLDFGFKGLGAIFEAKGKYLAASPMLSSVVLSGSLLQQLANSEQQAWLSDIISGEKRVALAFEEQARHAPDSCLTTATEHGNDIILTGKKTMVIDGVSPDAWLVTACYEGENRVFMVPFSEQVTVQRINLVDSRNYAEISFAQLKLPKTALLGSAAETRKALAHTLDLGRLCLSCELLGAAKALLNMTVEYLKVREQFGVKIGTFQALQHRAARCFVELELAQSTVMAALSAADNADSEFASSVSLAKWKLANTADLISNEAVQMHGGIGVTDELDIGLFVKRIRVAQMCLGDADFHHARFAALMA
jgi:alkylation response protein AidB-like acyl-CoA dehydrogenase